MHTAVNCLCARVFHTGERLVHRINSFLTISTIGYFQIDRRVCVRTRVKRQSLPDGYSFEANKIYFTPRVNE